MKKPMRRPLKKQRGISLLLVLVMTVTMLSGCKGQSGSTGHAAKSDKISISMYMWDRSMFKEFTPWLEQKFPDIEFTFVQSYNTMEYYKDLLARGESMPDIITCRRFSLFLQSGVHAGGADKNETVPGAYGICNYFTGKLGM